MNLSLISSFVIGSVLMLSLVKVNMSLVKNSMDSMNDQVAKVNISNVTTVIDHDFRKIGYGIAGTSLQEATAKKIRFQGDLNDDGTLEQVTWEYDQSQEVSETKNPKDYLLIRTVDGNSTEIKQGVIKFELSYYNEYNQLTTILDEVRKIKIQMVCESSEPVGDKYMKSGWEKTFMPLSINK